MISLCLLYLSAVVMGVQSDIDVLFFFGTVKEEKENFCVLIWFLYISSFPNLLQLLITGDRSSVRYVTYQNEDDDE